MLVVLRVLYTQVFILPLKLLGVSVPPVSCCALAGFYKSYLELAPQMLAAIDEYGGQQAPAIFVTGHSLGAAVSALATFELLLAGYPVTKHIDFGRPRVGNAAFATSFQQVVLQHNISGIRLNPEASHPWSPLLSAAVRTSHARLGAASSFDMIAETVKSSVLDFKNNEPAARSPNRAAKHAAMTHALTAVKNRVMSALSFQLHPSVINVTASFRVTHNADPVPHLPLMVMGFAHPSIEVFYNEDQSSYTACSVTDGEDPTCSNSLPLDIWIPDHLSYMNIQISELC
jgi:hypothetical protein